MVSFRHSVSHPPSTFDSLSLSLHSHLKDFIGLEPERIGSIDRSFFFSLSRLFSLIDRLNFQGKTRHTTHSEKKTRRSKISRPHPFIRLFSSSAAFDFTADPRFSLLTAHSHVQATTHTHNLIVTPTDERRLLTVVISRSNGIRCETKRVHHYLHETD